MKSRLFEFIYRIINYLYTWLNWRRKSVFIYSDSRGFDVIGKSGKNPFNSYLGFLIRKYRVTYRLCPEKHTTILDFLREIRTTDIAKYDYVILHCGVVDFSPRPISNLSFVLSSKEHDDLMKIARDKYADYYDTPSEITYQGEKTQTLYAPEFLEAVLVPELKKIRNLIWINSNHFVSGWDGNFDKGRPLNIEEKVNLFDGILGNHLENIVDLKGWTDEEVKGFTIDNIHFRPKGFAEVYALLNNKLQEIENGYKA
jgi:hypothetical protein